MHDLHGTAINDRKKAEGDDVLSKGNAQTIDFISASLRRHGDVTEEHLHGFSNVVSWSTTEYP
jgi:hypothetical protein